jgi:hypothetical protein
MNLGFNYKMCLLLLRNIAKIQIQIYIQKNIHILIRIFLLIYSIIYSYNFQLLNIDSLLD